MLRLKLRQTLFGRRLRCSPLRGFLRVDLEALRTLPRALDLLFLAVARFFLAP